MSPIKKHLYLAWEYAIVNVVERQHSGESQVRAPKVYGNSYVVNLSGKRTEYTKVILYMFCRTLMRLWNEDSTVFLFSELKNSREVQGNVPKWCTEKKERTYTKCLKQ